MPEPLDVVLLPHTHWDREWYHPAGVFRQRLVTLVDELLDDAETAARGVDGDARGFLLDGQAVVLDDYLAVRPDRRDALAAALASGAIEAGPWYVLADELIPSGEALVRNLLAGRRALAALGASAPPVLYSPDAFGHTAALPLLAEGFGCDVAIVWRGYGGARWPAGDSAWWTAPNGARVLLHHLPPDGYEFGSSLPTTVDGMRDRWARMRAVLAPRARLGVLLVQNGADHHARQRESSAAFDALAAVAAPERVAWGSLRGLARTLATRAADAALPTVSGELRDSYGYTWTLQGTFATRAAQKRRNAAVERALVRDVEPWLALVALRDGDDPAARALLHAGWRTLLLDHPHDTLCGCSTDEVARAADARFDDAAAQARALGSEARARLLRHDADAARTRRDAWRPTLVVRNRAARRRGGVAEVEVLTFVRDAAVGPGSAGTWRPVRALGATPLVDGGRVPLQVLGRALRHDRTEAPRHYPDDDLVEAASAVAWVPPLDGFALAGYAIGDAGVERRDASLPRPVVAHETTLDNGLLSVSVDARGTVALRDASTGAVIESAIGFEDVGDAGDLYTHSPLGAVLTTTWCSGTRLVHRGPLRGELAVRYRMRVPTAAATDAVDPLSRPTRRARRHVELPIEVRVVLDAEAPFARVHVRGENLARDHRLRIVFRTGVRGEVLADAAFGPIVRRPLDVPAQDTVAEQPPRTAPLHRWVSVSDDAVTATIFSDGLAEYEVTPDGDVAVTLVRAVGELSRPDLPERPGNAGWPVPTPEAQGIGPFEASFAIALQRAASGDGAAALQRIEMLADDVLLPLVGETLRSALAVPGPTGGLALEGEGLAFSAALPSDDGRAVVLRCVNLTDASVVGAWRLGTPVAEAHVARLDETPLAPIAVLDDASGTTVIPIDVPARGVHTTLVRGLPVSRERAESER